MEERGFSFITAGSLGSIPRDNAGRVSVTRLTHRIWIGRSGVAQPNRIARNNATISPRLQDSRNKIDFLMFR
ncbi:hypothetical protein D3C80_2175790 [compost metagenome]